MAAHRDLGDTYLFPDGSVLVIDYVSPLATGWLLTRSDDTTQHACHYYTDGFDQFVEPAEYLGQQPYVMRTDSASGGDYICG